MGGPKDGDLAPVAVGGQIFTGGHTGATNVVTKGAAEMTYNKPEIGVLGNATQLVELLLKDGTCISDAFTCVIGLRGLLLTLDPAYDLDE